MVVLKAYCDESEMLAGSGSIFAVVGALALADRWERFSDEWHAALSEHGIPRPHVFHMTDFENRRGPYADLSEKERVSLIRALIGAINHSGAVGVGYALVLDQSTTDSVRKEIGEPYEFCCLGLVRWILNHLDGLEIGSPDLPEALKDRIEFYFEHRHRTGRVLDAFRAALQRENRNGSIRLVPKEDGLAELQAADLLVYEATKAALRQ